MASTGVETSGGLQHTVPLWIAGNEVQTGIEFDVINPLTHNAAWKSCGAQKADAIQAVDAAQAAFSAWSRTKPRQRRDILMRAADILDRRAEELGSYMQKETGSAEFWSTGFNVPTSSEMLRDIAGRISSVAGAIPTCAEEGMNALIYREPYGVVLGIAPW
jgi:acyl-CoA reductase-like NAD-dependent aldehyde dehydrogenase